MIRLLLLIPLVLASPYTDPSLNWDANINLSLPWYQVSYQEVLECSQGLSTARSYDPDVVADTRVTSPIYMDTVTLLAKRTNNYYEVGWYVQPFTGSVDVEVTIDSSVIASGSASEQRAFDGYIAFSNPCTTSPCVDSPASVTLRYGDSIIERPFQVIS